MGWRRIDPIAPALTRRLEAAAPAALDDTTAAAAIQAKQDHGWRNRTGTAEGSIRMDPARKTGPGRWRGRFGSFDVAYFRFLELGTRFIRADHTLRRAADAEFPRLGANLRRRMS